jgi:amino acid transporter
MSSVETYTATKKVLGADSLALMTVAATDSLRNMPSMAVQGWSSVSWYLLGTLLFLIPSALVAAELATGWPLPGGVYAWVREAFGERAGFVGVWCEWVENVVWFPSISIFVGTSFAYAISPSLASNKYFLLAVELVVFWVLTAVNLGGLRASSLLQRFGVILGTMVPQVALLLLLVAWLVQGMPLQLTFSRQALRPELNSGTLPLVSTVIMLFAGMEITGYHANETRDPKRDYPRAIFIGATIIFVFSVLSTLAIALVVPVSQLSLSSGLMQAFAAFLVPFGLGWMLPIFAVAAGLGACATLTTWMLGPAKGLSVAARDGHLPPYFGHHNANDVPDKTLVLQTIVGSLFLILGTLLPSVNASYWIFSALTTEVLATMYIFMFVTALRLRYTRPDLQRAYTVPGGRAGIWVVCGAGILACVFVLIIGILPPGQAQGQWSYSVMMLLGYLLLLSPPFLLRRFREPGWQSEERVAAELA